jgi:hypothetical protein
MEVASATQNLNCQSGVRLQPFPFDADAIPRAARASFAHRTTLQGWNTMATIASTDMRNPAVRTLAVDDSTHASAVSWAAIFAGAATAAAISLIMLVLGTGLGLSAVSPWSQRGIEAGTFGVSTILWISFTALVASGLGGYLAGRLRTKWAAVHTDEVYFRDTAHGFLAWAIATLVTAGMLTSAVGTVVSAGASAASTGVAAAAAGAGATGAAAARQGASGAPDRSLTSPYLLDSLFRAPAGAPNQPSPTQTSAGEGADGANGPSGTKGEVARIFANSIRTGQLPPEDVRYAGQLVAQRTGMSQQDAEKRVADTYNAAQAKLRDAETAAKDAADKARRAAAYASLWMFVSLLLGAFVASLMATYGGRQRDLF